jgi:hypothetical protein
MSLLFYCACASLKRSSLLIQQYPGLQSRDQPSPKQRRSQTDGHALFLCTDGHRPLSLLTFNLDAESSYVSLSCLDEALSRPLSQTCPCRLLFGPKGLAPVLN